MSSWTNDFGQMTNKLLQRMQFSRIILLLFLVGLIGIGTVPGYLSGKWRWTSPPPVTNLKQLQAIRKSGLDIPGWQTLTHREIPISGHKWLFQAIERDANEMALLLLQPQNSSRDRPRVAWVDINGFQRQLYSRWETDSYQTKLFSATFDNTNSQKTVEVRARFFRGWHQQQTYAALQWYAWPNGGDPSPDRWFWADRMAQGKGDRAPWVAVCVLIPIEPLGEIEEIWPLAQSLGAATQAALMAGPLKFKR